MVSDIADYFEESVATKIVFELPPSESLNIFVSTESLYGMCFDLFDSFSITILRAVRDLFMLEAYLSLSPAARVDFCF